MTGLANAEEHQASGCRHTPKLAVTPGPGSTSRSFPRLLTYVLHNWKLNARPTTGCPLIQLSNAGCRRARNRTSAVLKASRASRAHFSCMCLHISRSNGIIVTLQPLRIHWSSQWYADEPRPYGRMDPVPTGAFRWHLVNRFEVTSTNSARRAVLQPPQIASNISLSGCMYASFLILALPLQDSLLAGASMVRRDWQSTRKSPFGEDCRTESLPRPRSLGKTKISKYRN